MNIRPHGGNHVARRGDRTPVRTAPAWATGRMEGRAAILDLDLDRMLALRPVQAKYQPVRRFPSSAFDLSVVTPLREPAGVIEEQLRAAAGSLLESIEYQRQYTGAPLAEGTRSISFRLTVGAADHTLSSEEVTGIRNSIINAMQRAATNYGYSCRVNHHAVTDRPKPPSFDKVSALVRSQLRGGLCSDTNVLRAHSPFSR